jgi:hypothetical protein
VKSPEKDFHESGHRKKCGDDRAEHMMPATDVLASLDAWTDCFAAIVGAKVRVEPGQWHAFGHEPRAHALAESEWREIRTGFGRALDRSSPAEQERLGLNRDATLQPAKSEGEKLRE